MSQNLLLLSNSDMQQLEVWDCLTKAKVVTIVKKGDFNI
jgi:hypothetical protein